MKKLYVIGLFIGFVVAAENLAVADEETNLTYQTILQTSNDVSKAAQLLPSVEALWPQQPTVYIKSIGQIAHVAGGSSDKPEGKQLMIASFSAMMNKSCPTNEAEAAAWVELKRDTIIFCLHYDEIRTDKNQWLAVAKFIGEVRSKRIPNYRHQGMQISAIVSTPEEELQLRKDIEANDRIKITDKFQDVLSETDFCLKIALRGLSTRFPPSDPANADFAGKIAKIAHLTDEEIESMSR